MTCISTIQLRIIANLTFEPNVNKVFVTLNMTFDVLLTSDCKNNPNNGLLITNWYHWFNNDFLLAPEAILAAVLDISYLITVIRLIFVTEVLRI